jgi:glucosamine-6-phosphate isomerase
MKLIISGTYEAMSRRAADDLLGLMTNPGSKLICPASGDTPSGLFKELVERCRNQNANLADWKFISLDEWAGMNGETAGSCRDYLNRQLFHPLEIKKEHIFFFDGKQELEPQCGQAEAFINAHRGIQVCILGLGLNGHVGMNEPGTPGDSRTHVAAIAEETQKTGQKYFPAAQSLTHGITLGVGSIFDSAHIMLLVSGKKKAAIVKALVEHPVTEAIPVTLLKNHPDFSIYLDADAASALSDEMIAAAGE